MPSRTNRFRGGRTHGRGKKAGRGAGKRGGRGNAGLHKHRFMTVLTSDRDHFGRHGFKRPQSIVGTHVTINVHDLDQYIETWVGKGLATAKGKGTYEVDLDALGYDKLLGKGEVRGKYNVTVGEASSKAVEKVQGAGGTVKTQKGGGDQ